MQIEKVGEAINQILVKNEFFRMLMGVSDYIIYGYTALLVIAQFISLGGFVNALLGYLFFVLLILGFAGKKYLGLVVLMSGKAFACVYGLFRSIYQAAVLSRYLKFSFEGMWEDIFGAVVFGLLIWLCVVLFHTNQKPAVPVGNPVVGAPPVANAPGQPIPTAGPEIPQPQAFPRPVQGAGPQTPRQLSEDLFKPPVTQQPGAPDDCFKPPVS